MIDYFPERKKGLIKQEGGGLCMHCHHGDAGSEVIIKTFLHQRQFSLHREKSELLKCRVQKKEPKLVFWYQPQGSVSDLREAPALSLFGQSLPSPSFEDVFSVNAWTLNGDSNQDAWWASK